MAWNVEMERAFYSRAVAFVGVLADSDHYHPC